MHGRLILFGLPACDQIQERDVDTSGVLRIG